MKYLALILPFILLFSCSVQKRRYQEGYYVNWKSKDKRIEKKAPQSDVLSHRQTSPLPSENLLQQQPVHQNPDLGFAPAFHKVGEDSCDVLVYRDGAEIRAKVIEVGMSEIKYKRCDTPDGPTYISRKSELFMIKYTNGTKEVMKDEVPEKRTQTRVPSQNNNTNTGTQPTYHSNYKQVHPLAIASLIFGILSIALCFFILSFIVYLTAGTAILFLPFISGIIAVLTGKTALNRIREQPEIFRGKGLAMPGFIMGLVIVGIYLTVLFFVALLFGL